MSAVDESTGTIVSPEVRTYGEVAKGYSSFKNGDVLFAKVTPCMENGKAAIAGSLLNELGFGSTEFHVLRPTNVVLPEYLFYFIRQPQFRDYAASAFVGTGGLQRVPADFFARVKLPLPTLPEQHRIVDVLRRTEAIGNLRKKAQAIIDKLAKQRFVEMFGHPAENPKNFASLPFQEFGTLDRGVSKHRPRDASHLFGGPYPFIQTGDVSNAGDWITTYKATYSEAGLAQSKLWPKGTLCITIAANIAKAAILEFDACFPDSVVGFTPTEGVYSEYVLYCLRFYQEFFEHRAPKSAQMNINLDALRTLRMPKPPEALQREFAEFVREIRLLNTASTTQVRCHEDLVKELRVAAFIGELTAQWREDHYSAITQAARERDDILHARGTRIHSSYVALFPSPDISIKHSSEHIRAARRWLIDELSEFQFEVWNMLHQDWQRLVFVDDPEVFDDFCTNPDTARRIERFEASPNRVRRTLEQLAALGLIAKVSLPKFNAATQQTEYLTAFRPLREDENTRQSDADWLRHELNTGQTETGA
jgi:type I restriction enzyme S subunit